MNNRLAINENQFRPETHFLFLLIYFCESRSRSLAEESAAMQKMAAEKPANAGTTNLGALLKAKLGAANTDQ